MPSGRGARSLLRRVEWALWAHFRRRCFSAPPASVERFRHPPAGPETRGDRTNNRTNRHTRAKPRALPARPRPCHPAHTRPIVISNDPPNAGAAAKIFFCSRAPFARPVVRRKPAHPTPTPAPPPRAPRPNPVAGASFPTSRLRAQRRGSIGRRSKPPRLRDRAEHRDDFCLLGAHPAEHGARSGRSHSPVPVGTHIGRRTRPWWVWVGVQSRGPRELLILTESHR